MNLQYLIDENVNPIYPNQIRQRVVVGCVSFQVTIKN